MIMKNKEILLIDFESREDKKIIIKKAIIENIKCLLKSIKELSKEKDNIIPIINSIEMKIKLILSISVHHLFILKKLIIYIFHY